MLNLGDFSNWNSSPHRIRDEDSRPCSMSSFPENVLEQVEAQSVPLPLLPLAVQMGEALFEQFCAANDLPSTLSAFAAMCDLLEINPIPSAPAPSVPNQLIGACANNPFYVQLRSRLKGSWKARTLLERIDKRAALSEYRHQTACSNARVLIIGAGPCGLRMAIESALLGARTVVIEKRHHFSRCVQFDFVRAFSASIN